MRGAVHYFKGIALHLAGDVDAAVSHLDRSYEAVPEIDIRIQQIVWLLESGRANDAEQYLRLARQDLAGRRWTRRVLNDDLQILHERIISQRRASP